MYQQTMQLENHVFTVELWDGISSPLRDTHIVIDTETIPIELGKVPTLSTLQVYYPGSERVVIIQGGEAARLYLKLALLLNPECTVIGHNFAFDFEVLGGVDNVDLLRAVCQCRAVCTGMRFLLKVMAKGDWVPYQKWSLDHVFKLFTKQVLDKDEALRLSFRPDVPLTVAQIHYAATDPVATWICFENLPDVMPTEHTQVKGSIALNRIGINGMHVNRQRLKQLQDKFKTIIESQQIVLHAFGYFVGVKNNTQRLQAVLRNIEMRSGLRFPRQAKNPDKISISKKLIAMYPDHVHPFLTAQKSSEHASKMLTTFLNDKYIGTDGRVHPSFNPMVRTGRCSASQPNTTNVPREEGIREQYDAEPGKVLLAVDYSQQELVALAENCFLRFGRSRMKEILESGVDLHKWLGAIIKQEYGNEFSANVNYRQMAKFINFGLDK